MNVTEGEQFSFAEQIFKNWRVHVHFALQKWNLCSIQRPMYIF